MAIEKVLSKTEKTNSYGIDFTGVYYKVEKIEPDFDRDIAYIEVRGYASTGARAIQKTNEAQRKYFMDLSMGGDAFDVAFKESEYTSQDDFRAYIDTEKEKYMQNIVGIFKETYEAKIEDLKIEEFTQDGMKKAGYLYLMTLPEFSGGKAV